MTNNRRLHRDTPIEVASGVEELINRLKTEGVQKGQAQAEQIVNDAKSHAQSIITQAVNDAIDSFISQRFYIRR